MRQLPRLGAVLCLAALMSLLAGPAGAGSEKPRSGLANVVPTTTVSTSPTVVARAKLSRTGSSSRALTLAAGLALLLGGAAVGLGQPSRRVTAGRPLP
jgi:hypothetical protein